MKRGLTQRISELQEAETLKMARMCRELQEGGSKVISLSLGEPDFATPEHIREAAIQAIRDGYSSYPPVPGYSDLREAIAAKFRRDNNLDYGASQVMVSTGAKQSLMNLLLALVEKGDEVILPAPYWVSYPQMVQFAQATVVPLNTSIENDYKITPEQLEAAITDKTRVFLFNSPCNPTGSVYSEAEQRALGEVLARHPEVQIISDEIYEYITYGEKHFSLAQIPELNERTTVVNGVSKGFAMTGWRIGYMAGPEWLIKGCEKLQGQFTSGACSISQRATLAALTSSLEPTRQMATSFAKRKKLVVEKLSQINGIKANDPKGAFYIFPEIKHYFGTHTNNQRIQTSSELCMYLLQDAHVSLVAGEAFGSPNCIRLSFAASETDLITGLENIKNSLDKLEV
ncbi:MAG: pyridoxal phosphate-dependent aminotransferase [Bacteroidia bacterium]